MTTRRSFIKAIAAGAAIGAGVSWGQTVPSTAPAMRSAPNARYRIGAADIMLLKRQKLGAIKLASDCDLDGVEVDMGSLSKNPMFANELRKEEVRKQYLDACRQYDIAICSIAMSAFYAWSFTDHPNAEAITADWVQTMVWMGTKVGYVPLRPKGKIAEDKEVFAATVAGLKKLAPIAEKAGVIMGVEAALDGEGQKRLVDEVGSAAVKVYYHTGNMFEAKYDLYEGLKVLGKDRICQIHLSGPDGKSLEQGPIEVKRIKGILDDIGWSGWLVLERARVSGRDVKRSFGTNARYLREVFAG